MKAELKVRGNLTIELDGEKQRDLFRAIASAQEVFGERCCGKCGSSDLRFRVRRNRDEQGFPAALPAVLRGAGIRRPQNRRHALSPPQGRRRGPRAARSRRRGSRRPLTRAKGLVTTPGPVTEAGPA